MYGRKNLLITGNVLASIILAVFALTTDPVLLLAAAIFEGISEAAVLASTSALLAEKVDNSKRNCVFSLYGFAQSIAFGLGSIAIPAVALFELLGFTNKESHVLLYVIMAVLSLVSTLIILKVAESRKLKKPGANIREFLPTKSKAFLSKYVLTGAIIAFGAGIIVPLMTAWFRLRYDVSDTVSGPILGISSILIGVATLASPSLAKRLGLVKTIVVIQAASTVFMFVTPLSPDFASASFFYSVRALLMNMVSPLSQSMIMGLVSEDERGAASGISGALWRLPNALSTFIGAWFMEIGLLAAPFFVATLFYIVSIMLFWYYFRKVRMPEEQA
jgi:MFS family permease